MAILTEASSEENTGKVVGLSISFITVGTAGGPFVAGLLLDWCGYWGAWSVPLGFLLLDILARLIMVEPENEARYTDARPRTSDVESITDSETTPILRRAVDTLKPDSEYEACQPSEPEANFYRVMLQDSRVLASIINNVAFSMILGGFNSTLPVHLQQDYDLSASYVSMVFFLLQAPSIFLGPVSGWVRDKVGLRYPTAITWLCLAAVLCFMGLAESAKGIGSRSESQAPIMINSCIAIIGVLIPFVQGAGFLNTRSKPQDRSCFCST